MLINCLLRTKKSICPANLCTTAQLTSKELHSVERQKKPLVVMLPWWGAPDKAISKYVQLYEDVGCKVIVKRAKQIHFLRPNLGLKKSKEFLFDIQKIVNADECPIVFHCTSIGCYFYALMLINLRDSRNGFENISSNIKAQVLDSPVIGTLNEMAVGVSSMTASNKCARSVLKNAVLSYFALTRTFTVKVYNQSLDVIRYHSPEVPSLMMTSDNDPMALPHAFQAFVDAWTSRGIDVTQKVWTDSEHAKHLKFHPRDYTELVHQVLRKTALDGVAVNDAPVVESPVLSYSRNSDACSDVSKV